ncbi:MULTISPECIES: hypothetical protein [Streptomyces]|nr:MULTISPECIES: hypothetical protein [Streptomyces]
MDSEPLQIPLDQLRRAFEMALDHVEASAGRTVTLEHDFFWSVPGDELHNVPHEPSALTIGSLADSWHQLDGLCSEPERAVAHHLVWLADVLRAIGREAAC